MLNVSQVGWQGSTIGDVYWVSVQDVLRNENINSVPVRSKKYGISWGDVVKEQVIGSYCFIPFHIYLYNCCTTFHFSCIVWVKQRQKSETWLTKLYKIGVTADEPHTWNSTFSCLRWVFSLTPLYFHLEFLYPHSFAASSSSEKSA